MIKYFFILFALFSLLIPLQGGVGVGCNFEEKPDADQDGVADVSDNCPNDYNPRQTDENGDGVGEVCEPFLPGGVDCSVRSCQDFDYCQRLVGNCPDFSEEVDGKSSCCDGLCVAEDFETSTGCPPETCPNLAAHCEDNSGCSPSEVCLDGCCAEIECPDGGFAPQCDPETGEGCDPGETCIEPGCCLPGGDLCAPTCDQAQTECGGCEACSGGAATCNPETNCCEPI